MKEEISPQIFIYATYSEIIRLPQISFLRAKLEEFDMLNTIILLAKLNLLIADREEFKKPNFQRYLCNIFLNNYTKEKVFNFMSSNPNTVLFHRHQLLFLLKNIFIHSKENPTYTFDRPNVRYKLGTCCLIANDFLQILKMHGSQNNPNLESIWKEAIPSYEVYNPTELKHEIARTRIIFKDIFPAVRKSAFIDINQIFKEIISFSLNDYISLIFAVIVLYFDRRKKLLDDPNAIFIETNNFTAQTEITPKKIEHLLNLISLPIEKYKEEILNSPDKELNYGFLPFRKYPLARINKKYICFDFNFLLDKISRGVFWSISEYLKKKSGEFHALWGKLFESYVDWIFEKAFSDQKGLFYSHPKYANVDEEIADGILYSGEDILLLEYKFTILSQEAKYGISIDKLLEELELKFEKNRRDEWKGYGQLANSINKLFSKESNFSCKIIKKDKIKRVFPILIVYEDILNAPFTNYFFNKKFKKLINGSSIFPGIEVKPLVIIGIEELERIEYFLRDLPKIILERYEFNPNMVRSFSDFLVTKQREGSLLLTTFIDREFRECMNEIRKDFFGA